MTFNVHTVINILNIKTFYCVERQLVPDILSLGDLIMLIRHFVLPATIAATSFFSINAHAQLDANQTLNQFNAIVFGNVVSHSHVDGRTWVGGNVSGGDYVQHAGDTPASSYAGLTVKGNASNLHVNGLGAVIVGNFSNAIVNTGSTAVLGNVTNSNLNGPAYVAGISSGSNFNGGDKLPSPNDTMQTNLAAVDSTDFHSLLSNTSSALSQLSNTSSVTVNGSTATFSAVVDATGLAAFNLTDAEATQIFSLGQFDFLLNGATTVIINSGLENISISANFLASSAHTIGSSVIWNFYDASSIVLNSQFGGSVLAVDATLTNYQNIEGGVYVQNLNQYGEIHLQPFTGNLVTAVPEPSSYAMFLIGLGLLAFSARRRT